MSRSIKLSVWATLLIATLCAGSNLNRLRRYDPPTEILAVAPSPNICGPKTCPPGWKTTGSNVAPGHVNCEVVIPSYGRGLGVSKPLIFGNEADVDLIERCRKENPVLGCEIHWTLKGTAYPKCRWGYEYFGCCVCKSKCPGTTLSNGVCQMECAMDVADMPWLENMDV